MTQTIKIVTATGVHAFQVEIARDDASRMQGLSGHQSMAPNHGMLFTFDREAPRVFNMERTLIPLDVIFLSQAGAVTHIAANAQPQSEHGTPSNGPCSAVLELNGGMAAYIGLKIGDKVEQGGGAIAGKQIDPRLLEAARYSPMLKHMIEKAFAHPRDVGEHELPWPPAGAVDRRTRGRSAEPFQHPESGANPALRSQCPCARTGAGCARLPSPD